MLRPGAALVLFSDGLIERRGEDIDVSRDRLAAALAQLDEVSARTVFDSVQRDSASDDATVVTLLRPR